MELTLVKKMKRLQIFLIISLIVGITVTIYSQNFYIFILTLFYCFFIWKNKNREIWIRVFYISYTVLAIIVTSLQTNNIFATYIYLSTFYSVFSIISTAIAFIYLVCFSINIKVKIRSIKTMQKILLLLLWIYIAGVIVYSILAATSQINNQSAYLTFDALRTTIIVTLAMIFGVLAFLPQIVLLYIIQQSFDPEFYEALIKTNPRTIARDAPKVSE